MLVFSTQLNELLPSNLLSGSTLSPLICVYKYTAHTHTVCKGGGVWGLRQINTCRKVPLQVILLEDDILHCLLWVLYLWLAGYIIRRKTIISERGGGLIGFKQDDRNKACDINIHYLPLRYAMLCLFYYWWMEFLENLTRHWDFSMLSSFQMCHRHKWLRHDAILSPFLAYFAA